jgi:hypothetical protein
MVQHTSDHSCLDRATDDHDGAEEVPHRGAAGAQDPASRPLSGLNPRRGT